MWIPGIHNPCGTFSDKDGWEFNHLLEFETREAAEKYASEWAHRPKGRLRQEPVQSMAKEVEA